MKNTRRFLVPRLQLSAVFSLSVMLLGNSASAAEPSSEKPNVLLIAVDDLND
jgi:hypothetical protein